MIYKMSKWVDKNEDTLMKVYGFGLAIALGIGLIVWSFLI